MILEWNLQVLVHVLTSFIDAWGDWQLPSWVAEMGPTLEGFFARFDGLGVWAPWDVIGYCIAGVLATYVICITVKIVLRIASYLPFVGGAG